MSVLPALLIVTLLLAVQARLAARFGAATRLILRLQAAFWFLCFVVRPAVEWRMKPVFPNRLADYRLAVTNYGAGLAHGLEIVVCGLLAYVAALFLFSRARRTVHQPSPRLEANAIRALLLLLGLAWVGRVAFVIAATTSLADALAPMGTAAACILLFRWQVTSRGALVAAQFAILLSELAWSVISASKSPILAALVALSLRFILTARRAIRFPVLALTALVGFAAFLSIQQIKGIDTQADAMVYRNYRFPAAAAAGVSVLQRADLFTSVTDAADMNQRWVSTSGFVKRLLLASTPKGPFYKSSETSGEAWAREVRGQTVPNEPTNVSVAEGTTAEGWAVGGAVGAILESLALALVVTTVGRLVMAPRPQVAIFAATFIFGTALLERGLIGLGESLANGLEASVAVAVLLPISRMIGVRRQIQSAVKVGEIATSPSRAGRPRPQGVRRPLPLSGDRAINVASR